MEPFGAQHGRQIKSAKTAKSVNVVFVVAPPGPELSNMDLNRSVTICSWGLLGPWLAPDFPNKVRNVKNCQGDLFGSQLAPSGPRRISTEMSKSVNVDFWGPG